MDTKQNKLFLSDIVKMEFPQSVYEEVQYVITLIHPDFDFTLLTKVFRDIISLYNGHYPGYKPCNTHYHDLKHTTDVMLALTRIVHGAHVNGLHFSEKHIETALLSSLLHDTGYIQLEDDHSGFGGKYSNVRLERSIEFLKNYFIRNNLELDYLKICKELVSCTDPNEAVEGKQFTSKENLTLGMMLGTADILGQIADRTYIEKLLFLFLELNEVRELRHRNELEFLKSTLDYFSASKQRLVNELDDVKRYLAAHFKARWSIEYDMYMDAVESNVNYLTYLTKNHEKDYRDKLKRGGLLKKLAIQETQPDHRHPE
jgi:hypothetical protein